MYLEKPEVLKRLCALSSEVRNAAFENQASDCFCGQSASDPMDEILKRTVYRDETFKFESEIIEFIEKAVRSQLKPRDDLAHLPRPKLANDQLANTTREAIKEMRTRKLRTVLKRIT